MQTLAPYLDRLKLLKGLDKDADLARLLKVSRAHVSQLRSGSYMGESKCFELARLLDIEPLELLSLNRALRNKETEVRRYWMAIHENTRQYQVEEQTPSSRSPRS